MNEKNKIKKKNKENLETKKKMLKVKEIKTRVSIIEPYDIDKEYRMVHGTGYYL